MDELSNQIRERRLNWIFLRHKHLSFRWLIYVIIYAASGSGKQLAGSEFCCWNTPHGDRSRQRRHENGVVTIFVIKEEYREIHLNRIYFYNRYGAATHQILNNILFTAIMPLVLLELQSNPGIFRIHL